MLQQALLGTHHLSLVRFCTRLIVKLVVVPKVAVAVDGCGIAPVVAQVNPPPLNPGILLADHPGIAAVLVFDVRPLSSRTVFPTSATRHVAHQALMDSPLMPLLFFFQAF